MSDYPHEVPVEFIDPGVEPEKAPLNVKSTMMTANTPETPSRYYKL
jgi:hypothetical protein